MPKSRKERSQAKATRKLAERSDETSLGKIAERSTEKVSSDKSGKKKGTLHHFPSKRTEKLGESGRQRLEKSRHSETTAKPAQRHEPKPPFPKQKQPRPG